MTKIILYSLLAAVISLLMFALLPLLLAVWLRSQAKARRAAEACSLGYDYEVVKPYGYAYAEQSIDDYLRWLLTK